MYRRQFLPPVAQLIALEATARHESISRAAEELHLTQGAVSRQICHLEQRLGITLFNRVKQRVVLTEVGRAYASEIRQAFDALSAATQKSIMARDGASELNLSVLPTFGTEWQMPRMRDFWKKYPWIGVNFSCRIKPFDFRSEKFDAAIHSGNDYWPDASRTLLFEENLLPICSSDYAKEHGFEFVADLQRASLLQQASRPSDWPEWFARSGSAIDFVPRGAVFEHSSMMAQAVISGLGVALLPQMLIEKLLPMNTLHVLFNGAIVGKKSYYLMVPSFGVESAVLGIFKEWILLEAAQSQIRSAILVP